MENLMPSARAGRLVKELYPRGAAKKISLRWA